MCTKWKDIFKSISSFSPWMVSFGIYDSLRHVCQSINSVMCMDQLAICSSTNEVFGKPLQGYPSFLDQFDTDIHTVSQFWPYPTPWRDPPTECHGRYWLTSRTVSTVLCVRTVSERPILAASPGTTRDSIDRAVRHYTSRSWQRNWKGKRNQCSLVLYAAVTRKRPDGVINWTAPPQF